MTVLSWLRRAFQMSRRRDNLPSPVTGSLRRALERYDNPIRLAARSVRLRGSVSPESGHPDDGVTAHYRCPDCDLRYEGWLRGSRFSSWDYPIVRRCQRCRERNNSAARSKAWRERNRDRIRAYKLRRARFTLKAWHRKGARLGWKCHYCQKQLDATAKGGPDAVIRHKLSPNRKPTLRNFVPACRACHNKQIRLPRRRKRRTLLPMRVWQKYKTYRAAGYTHEETLTLLRI